MIKYWARQVDWENQDSDLFYNHKDNKTGKYEWGFNDDYYTNETIIWGNNHFATITTKEFDYLLKIDDWIYEYELTISPRSNGCYWDNPSQCINYYLPRSNGKQYTPKQIHKWKQLLENYIESGEICYEEALELMTNKKWRAISLRGCSQGDWQEGFVSELVSDKMVNYLEICYMNTGVEYRVFESQEDFDNNEDGYSIYVDSWKAEDNLFEAIGCKEDEIEIYNFTGYSKVNNYERAR